MLGRFLWWAWRRVYQVEVPVEMLDELDRAVEEYAADWERRRVER